MVGWLRLVAAGGRWIFVMGMEMEWRCRRTVGAAVNRTTLPKEFGDE